MPSVGANNLQLTCQLSWGTHASVPHLLYVAGCLLESFVYYVIINWWYTLQYSKSVPPCREGIGQGALVPWIPKLSQVGKYNLLEQWVVTAFSNTWSEAVILRLIIKYLLQSSFCNKKFPQSRDVDLVDFPFMNTIHYKWSLKSAHISIWWFLSHTVQFDSGQLLKTSTIFVMYLTRISWPNRRNN